MAKQTSNHKHQTSNIKPLSVGPLVGIVMGSESDLEIMNGAAEMLRQFEVEPELTIVSAHRTPERLRDYAQQAKDTLHILLKYQTDIAKAAKELSVDK